MKNILALGAENKIAFSVLDSDGLYLSDPVDSLTDIDNFNNFEYNVKSYLSDKGLAPERVACDLHPDYGSTRLAEKFHKQTVESEIVRVQHHFAHIVSCMADNDIDGKVIGVSFDGTGYGSDGKSWGGEFLICDRKSFEREYHLHYVPQPGGDLAAREGWRMGLAYLAGAYEDSFEHIDTPILHRLGRKKTSVIKQMIDKEINCPVTSSAGRLFDAVSSIAGICDESSFEAEAAIQLEEKAYQNIKSHYSYDVVDGEVIVSRMIREIVDDVDRGVETGLISAKFHNTVGEVIFDVCGRLKKETGIDKVLISGGCFQNKYLVAYIEKVFKGSGLELYKHKKYSPTDLGISVGQAIVASSF